MVMEATRLRIGRRLQAGLLALAISLLFAEAAPRAAEAANYVVHECKIPGDPYGAPDAWHFYGTGGASGYLENNCNGGHPDRYNYGLSLTQHGGVPNGQILGFTIYAAPNTRVAELDFHAHRYNATGITAIVRRHDPGLVSHDAVGDPSSPGSNGRSIIGGGTAYEFWLQCGQQPQCVGYYQGCYPVYPQNCGQHAYGAWMYVSDLRFTVTDQVSPSASLGGGSLFEPGVKRGRETLTINAGDAGGGIRGVRLWVNGALSKQDEFCGPPGGFYRSFVPCPGSASRALEIDTETESGWVDGPNAVKACSYDVSGVEACVNQTVQVDNSCPASGGTAAANIDAGVDLQGRSVKAANVKSTDKVVVRGKVTGPGGEATQGATVCIFETLALDDASRELVAKATTQPNGRFATELDPGPSKDLEIVYRNNNKALSEDLTVGSEVVPVFKAVNKSVSNGNAARFQGWLPAPNHGSRSVTLQAKAGKKWRTFKQLRTNADGTFKGKYRFLHTSGKVTYRFRAAVKRQGGYPYEPGASKKAKVKVNG